ncbi:MAG: AGE family epimerase/isomerase [Bdellovibrionales bacterium]
MSSTSIDLKEKCRSWLKDQVFPLWCREGFDQTHGVFVENLSFEGRALQSSLRSLVQARQIYSFCEGLKMKVVASEVAKPLVVRASHSFVQRYQSSSGAFYHSVDSTGQAENRDHDLYTQAFALFALAYGYEISQDPSFQQAAHSVETYLRQERSHSRGGFTEIKGGQVLFQSNPHMHLFEAALVWRRLDPDPTWKRLSDEIDELCRSRFINPETGLLAEHFDPEWRPLRKEGRFIFEPGHHFEWSWLFHQFQNITRSSREEVSRSLFDKAEHLGLSRDRKLAIDEVWSDGQPCKLSSRFWPQTERVKAAVVLKHEESADIALQALIDQYLLMDQGLWRDTRLEDGSYATIPVKASSLYHIINAMSEYVALR